MGESVEGMQEVEDMLQHPLSEEELKKAIEKHLGLKCLIKIGMKSRVLFIIVRWRG